MDCTLPFILLVGANKLHSRAHQTVGLDEIGELVELLLDVALKLPVAHGQCGEELTDRHCGANLQHDQFLQGTLALLPLELQGPWM